VPIQLAQCWFPGLAISNAKSLKYKYVFQNKIYGSNFISQHSESVMVSIYQSAEYGFKDGNLLGHLL